MSLKGSYNYSESIIDGLELNLVEQCLEIENTILKKISNECLGREFQVSDADRFTIIINPEMTAKNEYQIAFDGEVIGLIKRHYGMENDIMESGSVNQVYKVTFNPITE